MGKRAVSVIGLGPMGQAMAEAYLAAGYEVTVWNRTRAKAEPLAARGATVAGSVGEALAAGGPVLLSLIDTDAMYPTLGEADLSGRVLVNLSSDSPEKVRAAARWAAGRGASYLVGAMNIPPSGMGKPESSAFYSGPRELYEALRADLEVLTTPDFRGEEPGLAALYYQLNMVVFWSSMTGWLQAVALAEANGLTAADFLPYATYTADSMRGFLEFYAPRVDAGDHGGAVDRLTMCLASIEHVLHTVADSGNDTSVLAAHAELFRRGVAAGHGSDSSTHLVRVLRAPAAA
ncbi:NAD(P)-dependent oxidoreductase [Streptomyces sp. NPDC101132]|uniref:NAD(P)-dependent oxidoreductase n=1 Tax=Streptomyces sp. NPDC101132 TaxID=3366110 RepID=UPI00381BE372